MTSLADDPLTTGAAPVRGVDGALIVGAVDHWHVAARLEASGIGDRAAAQRHGVDDVFLLASSLDLDTGRSVDAVARTQRGLLAAVLRALLLLAGVATAGELLTFGAAGADVVWISGVAGWVGGQAVAGVTWTRLGAGQLAAGVRAGATLTLAVLGLSAVLPLVLLPGGADAALGALLATVWAAYACSVSLLVAAGLTVRALLAVAVPLAASAAATVVPGAPLGIVALVSSFVAIAAVLTLAVQLVGLAGGPALPSRQDVQALVPAAGQAALLATTLLVVLRTVPGSGSTAIVVASVAGAAMADPAIALLRWRARQSASRLFTLTSAARQARRAALAAAGLTTALSALMAAAIVLALSPEGDGSWTVAVAAGFTMLATTSAALNAFWAPGRAVLAAAFTLGGALVVVTTTHAVAGVAFAVAVALSVGLLLDHVSDPRVIG